MSLEVAIAVLVCLAGFALFAWVIRNEHRRTIATDDGTTWTQAGVSVDISAGTIRIGGDILPVARVTRVATGHSVNSGGGRFPAALITLDRPEPNVRRIPFALKGSANTFAWRLRDVLTRAGNPHPDATNKPFLHRME